MKENLIIDYLLSNEEYFRKVLPHVKREYFSDTGCKIIFGIVEDYYNEYGNLPNRDVLRVSLESLNNLKENDYNNCVEVVNNLDTKSEFNIQWAVDKTEEYCKNRAIYNAIMDSIKIFNGETQFHVNSIPNLLQDALATKFEKNIGHNYTGDSLERFKSYNESVEKIPFDLQIFNEATRGGLERKTLNLMMGATGTGKTLVMCHLAASWFMMGYKVLYISMEMAENKISKRIDCNLLNIKIHEIDNTPVDKLVNKMQKLVSKTSGQLFVKEFPTSGANTLHFKFLLDDLKINDNFVPDIIFIDYLNICSSSRLKSSALSNPYLYYKTVAEEIRALAIQTNTCIVSATQTNRGGFKNSDIDLDDTSDSFGLPMTMDLFWGLIATDELSQMNQMLIKQLKSRYDNVDRMSRFVIGVDKDYMRLYECDASAQDDILNDKPVMDNTKFTYDFEEMEKKLTSPRSKLKGKNN